MGGDGVCAGSSRERPGGVADGGGPGHAGVVRVVTGFLPYRFPTARFPMLPVPVTLSLPVTVPVPLVVSISFSVVVSISLPFVVSLSFSFVVPVSFSFVVSISFSFSLSITFSVPVVVSFSLSFSVAVSVSVSVPLLAAIFRPVSFLVPWPVSVVPGQRAGTVRGVGPAGCVLVVVGREGKVWGAPSGLPTTLIPASSGPVLPILCFRRVLRRFLEHFIPAVPRGSPIPRGPATAVPVPRPPPVPIIPQEGLVHPHPGVPVITPPVLQVQGIRHILPEPHVSLSRVLPASLVPPAGGSPCCLMCGVRVAIA